MLQQMLRDRALPIIYVNNTVSILQREGLIIQHYWSVNSDHVLEQNKTEFH